VQNLGVLAGGTYSRAFDINDLGSVVGISDSSFGPHAVLWTAAGGMTDLGALAGDDSSRAYGINNSGAVVGYSSGPNGMGAFLWTGTDGMKSLGFLPGDTYSRALGIGNSGTVVGASGGMSGVRAFIWTAKDGMQDLNALIPANSGVVLTEAHGINDRGQILVLGTDPHDGHNDELANRAFVLTPAP
jgi:probable HAF family extracellular repeat protein